MKHRTTFVLISAIAAGCCLGFGLRSVFADGIPSPNPLYYSGTLTEGGKLVNDTRAITINLWPDGTTQGSPLCTTVASSPPAQVVNGRFRIALASSCKQVINANSNAYVEVIDGATSLGRVPMGAVPYAVEADHAVNADNATASGTLAQQVVPSGAVIFFKLSACPAGWSEYAPAQGRSVVGVVDGGTLAAIVGTALGDQE